jgi:molybdate transport system ATP-binding protein
MLTCRFSAALGDTVIAPDFTAPPGVTVLFGPSGSGKTVTLRAVAGLLRPDRGEIRVGDRVFFDGDAGVDVPPGDRGVGYLPQSLALYPHMTVAENIAFGTRARGATRDAQVRRMLDLLDLHAFEQRKPGTLSGGQQQRVALARALSREDVRLLLMDEPLSALDEALRDRLRRELLALRAEVGFDALFVTHDLREAFVLADWIVLIDEGRVIRSGSRDEVFARPGLRRAAELMGFGNLLRGHVVERSERELLVEVAGARLRAAATPDHDSLTTGAAVDIAVRREEVLLHRSRPDRPGGTNLVEMRIVEEIPYGAGSVLRLRSADGALELESDMPVRPYRVMRVQESRDWLVEIAPVSVHAMLAGSLRAEKSPGQDALKPAP